MDEATVSMIFRIEKGLKNAFERVAKEKDLTSSQMLRAYVRSAIEEHIKQNAQKDLFQPVNPRPTQKPAKKTSKPAGSTLMNALLKRQ